MKTSKIIAAIVGMGISSAFAGPMGQPTKGGPIAPPPSDPGCICFDGGVLEFGAFGSYIFSDDAALDGEPGVGVSLGYFFTEFVGVQASYTAIFSSQEVHDTAASLVLRYPLRDLCFAPYVYGGGGYAVDSVNQATGHAGAGLDFRFDNANCLGFFVDYRYTFADKTSDWQAISAGLKVNF